MSGYCDYLGWRHTACYLECGLECWFLLRRTQDVSLSGGADVPVTLCGTPTTPHHGRRRRRKESRRGRPGKRRLVISTVEVPLAVASLTCRISHHRAQTSFSGLGQAGKSSSLITYPLKKDHLIRNVHNFVTYLSFRGATEARRRQFAIAFLRYIPLYLERGEFCDTR